MAIAVKLANARVRWFTDNQNVARILKVGSKKQQLHAIALKVFSLVVQHHISLEPEWILRQHNERADQLSRIIDYGCSIPQYLHDWMRCGGHIQ